MLILPSENKDKVFSPLLEFNIVGRCKGHLIDSCQFPSLGREIKNDIGEVDNFLMDSLGQINCGVPIGSGMYIILLTGESQPSRSNNAIFSLTKSGKGEN